MTHNRDDKSATEEVSGVSPVRVKAPTLGLPVLRWEYRELPEKDEKFQIVYRDGKPVICMSWVIIYLQAPDGTEFEVEVERKEFDAYLFPQLLLPSLLFWRQVRPGDALYPQRSKWLPLLEAWNSRL